MTAMASWKIGDALKRSTIAPVTASRNIGAKPVIYYKQGILSGADFYWQTTNASYTPSGVTQARVIAVA